MLERRIQRVATVLAAVALLVSGCGGQRARSDPEKIAEQTNAAKHQAAEWLDAGNHSAAARILEPLAETGVTDPQVYSMLGRALWKLGRYDDAIEKYEDAMRLDYGDVVTHIELAQLLMEIGKTGRALTEFELAVQYGNRDPLAYYNYGLALHELGREGDALAQWQKAYSLDPTNPLYAEAVGIGLGGEDDNSAVVYFERADSLGADSAGFHNNYGLLLQRLGRYDDAETQFKRAVERAPENRAYRSNLALLYMVSGRFGDAVPLWKALRSEDGEDPAYRVYLARAFLEMRRYREAIGLLEGWVDRVDADRGRKRGSVPGGTLEPPPLDEAYDVLAMAQRGFGDLEAALESIRKALEIKPDNVIHLINYGVILAESGNIADARSQWERVLELDPGNKTAEQNLSAFAQ